MIVGGGRGRLNDEHVLAADVLLHLDENLHVGEAPDHASGEGDFEVASDRLGEGAVAVACNQFHPTAPRPPSLAKKAARPRRTTRACNKRSGAL